MKLLTQFCLLLICSASVAAQIISTRAGLVKNVRGEAFYRCYLNEKEAAPLEKGINLHNGDTILTTETGSVAVALNPDSYLVVAENSFVRIEETDLGAMHFDVERGEVLVISRSFKSGVALVIHTPPTVLTVFKSGSYRFYVGANGDTEANVGRGELRYIDEQGELRRLKKGRKVNFIKRGKV